MQNLPHMKDSLFTNAFHHAPIGMALVGLDGRWLRVNRALCELLGCSEIELLSSSFQDITHPDDLEADLGYVRAMLLGAIKTYQMEKRYVRKDGRVVWTLLSVSLCRNSEGEPSFFISQIQDLTARKEAEAALQKSNEVIAELRETLVTVCAWTQRIQHDGQWMNMSEFLSERLGLRLTHSVSEEVAEELLREPVEEWMARH
jgi:PAS domain S-box-containing protein